MYLRMDFWQGILHNRALITAVAAWLIAQVLKTIIYFFTAKELKLSRMVGDGGMPSAHSATVMALATRCAIEFGSYSSEFAIAAIFAIVVMHDAMGVRRESGRHAQALNELFAFMDQFMDESIDFDVKLKEFLGHTPTQVIAGGLLGFFVAIVSGSIAPPV